MGKAVSVFIKGRSHVKAASPIADLNTVDDVERRQKTFLESSSVL